MSAEAGATDAWDLTGAAELSTDEQAWMDRALGIARRLGVVAGFAIGLGLILIGIGNGIWRLTALETLGHPRGVMTFLAHLATASTLVVLGASLLPVALHALSDEEDLSLAKPAVLFATLWLVIGLFELFTGNARTDEAIGGSIVLVLSGIFGLAAVSLYDPHRTGPSLSSGVLGLVASGLLIGGVATVPGSITDASRFGAELIFRYGEAVHVSGYLIGILAATVYPFVRADDRGPSAVLLAASLGAVLWGLGEVVFAAWWLSSTPWTLFGALGAGASAGYAFVLAGGLATVVGGFAILGAASALTGYAATPLASSLGTRQADDVGATNGAGASTRSCPSCGTSVTTSRQTCPGCGRSLSDHGCEDCGAQLGPEAAFCPRCGTEAPTPN